MSSYSVQLEVKFEGCRFGLLVRRVHEHMTLGQPIHAQIEKLGKLVKVSSAKSDWREAREPGRSIAAIWIACP